MFKPDRWLKRWYDKYNARYFDNKLPSTCQVGWNEALPAKTLGLTMQFTEPAANLMIFNVGLHPSLRECSRDHAKLVLLHEMVHVKLAPYMAHGRRFQQEMQRLARDGAMKDLW